MPGDRSCRSVTEVARGGDVAQAFSLRRSEQEFPPASLTVTTTTTITDLVVERMKILRGGPPENLPRRGAVDACREAARPFAAQRLSFVPFVDGAFTFFPNRNVAAPKFTDSRKLIDESAS